MELICFINHEGYGTRSKYSSFQLGKRSKLKLWKTLLTYTSGKNPSYPCVFFFYRRMPSPCPYSTNYKCMAYNYLLPPSRGNFQFFFNIKDETYSKFTCLRR